MATTTKTASEQITDEVTSWPGVEAGTGRRGEFGFRVGGREIGHLHGDRAAHFGFPRDLGARLKEEGRVGPHPVNPHSSKMAARPIESEADVREVIDLMRLNYERVTGQDRAGSAGPGPGTEGHAWLESPVEGLYASAPQALSFAPRLEVRSFVLRRDSGNLLIYNAPALDAQAPAIEALGGVSRRYLNHGHEAMFGPAAIAAPLFVHEADRRAVEERDAVRGTFSKRHTLDGDFEAIPTPGHTPGATAYLWDSGQHRFLFTGDTIYLDGGEWVAAVLESSDRDAYVTSLELLRELDFDVLVPWAASTGEPYVATTSREDATRRIDAVIDRLRRSENS